MRAPLILLTGGTGFVGSHVAAAVAARSYRLRCTVRQESDTRWLDPLDAETVVADVRDPEAVDRALTGVDVVIHGAGITRAADADAFFKVNTEGTLALAKAAAATGVERFVFISSLAARGPDPPGEPPGASTEDAPESTYGMSKLAAEERLRAFADRMDVVILRPGGVYGPRDTEMLPLFRMGKWGHLVVPVEDTLLQPVYAGDVAQAALRAIEADARPGPYDVMGHGMYTWREVGRALQEALGRRIRIHRMPSRLLVGAAAVLELVARLTGHPPAIDRRRARDLALRRWTADIGAASRDLDWQPRVALPQGLKHTARWYRDVGWL